ncbi:MAG TPA: spore coat protein YlbD [Bacillales bacterium]|nr:spore coat protein YlbD [Bacillales bacterium]
MAQEQLARFKEFAKNHPKLVEEVRKNNRTWQEIYEEWAIFGEDHEIWEPFSEGKSAVKSKDRKKTMANIMSVMKQIDLEDLQSYISEFGGVLTNVQKVMETFQGGNGSSASHSTAGNAANSRQQQQGYGYGPFPPPQYQQSPYTHRQPY